MSLIDTLDTVIPTAALYQAHRLDYKASTGDFLKDCSDTLTRSLIRFAVSDDGRRVFEQFFLECNVPLLLGMEFELQLYN